MALASVCAIMSCTKAESSASGKATASKTTKAGQVAMKMSKKCEPNTLHQSICMIELILQDVAANYHWVSGDVSSIKALSSTSYEVTIPQDERADIFTYDFATKADGTVTLKSKKESTKSY